MKASKNVAQSNGPAAMTPADSVRMTDDFSHDRIPYSHLPLQTKKDGFVLALHMRKEFAHVGQQGGACEVERILHPEQRQLNLVHEYLNRVLAMGTRSALEGFTAGITQFLVDADDSSEFYEAQRLADQIDLEESLEAISKSAFVAIVSGNKMKPRFDDGSIIAVDPKASLSEGSVFVAYDDDGDLVLRSGPIAPTDENLAGVLIGHEARKSVLICTEAK